MKIKEIIVVEGKSDTVKLQQTIGADTIETNGSALNRETLQRIQHAQEKRGVIIFTDPDYPGKRLRHLIDQAVPGCKHAFLTQDKARSKQGSHKSLGIEHASKADIEAALAEVYELVPDAAGEVVKQDLLDYGLIGGIGARERRAQLGELLHIGHTNGKQLLKRLTMFQITKKEFVRAMERVQQGEHNDV